MPENTPTPPTPVAPIIQPLKTTNSPLTVILLLLALVLLGSTGYLAYQNMQLTKQISGLKISTSSPVATSDQTANWKTYMNSQYSFSFKYPETWAVNNTTINPQTDLIVAGKEEEILALKTRKTDTEGAVFPFEISVSSLKPNYITDEFEKVTVNQITFLGKDVTQYTRAQLITTMYGIKGDILISIVIPIDQKFLEIKSFRPSDNQGIFDQILSTFKFTR